MRALFISSGGYSGTTALGMLHGLNAEYTHVCGNSVGALIAAALAHSGDTRACVQEMYLKLQHDHVASPWTSITGTLGTIVNALYALVFRRSLFQNRLPQLAAPYLHQPRTKTLQVGAYNATKGCYTTFSQDSPYIDDAIIASAAVPGVFAPVVIAGDEFIDGAFAHVLPVPEIREYWTHHTGDVDILLCYPTALQGFLHCQRTSNGSTSLSHHLETYTYEVMWNTMQADMRALERLFGAPLSTYNRFGNRTVRFLKPTESIFCDFVSPSPDAIKAMFEHGQAVGAAAAHAPLRL